MTYHSEHKHMISLLSEFYYADEDSSVHQMTYHSVHKHMGFLLYEFYYADADAHVD